MELNVGDYVRTKYGKIGRIISFDKSICFDLENAKENIEDVAYEEEMLVVDTHYVYEDEEDMYFKDDIIKTAEGTPRGLLNLIEVGDYVNGWRVNRVEKQEDGIFLTIGSISSFVSKNETDPYLTQDYNEKNRMRKIESIVTKEQFEEMQYIVKED